MIYYGHFYQLEPVEAVARVRVLMGRIHALRQNLAKLPEDPKRDRLLELLNATQVSVLVPPAVGAERVHQRITEFQQEDWKVPVTVMTPEDLEKVYREERKRMEP